MPLRFVALLGLLAALLAPASVWADEPDAAAAYAAKVKSLPAPAKELGFRFDGVLRVGGKPVGHATFFATPHPDDAATWRAGDMIVIKAKAKPLVRIADAQLSRSLALLKGGVETSADDDVAVSWVRTDKGVRCTSKTKEGAVTTEKVRNFELDGHALTTLGGTIFFARHALPDKATYSLKILEPRAAMKGEGAFKSATLEVVGEQELQGQKVLAVRGRTEDQSLELLFRPKSKELVGVRIVEGEERVEILKGDLWSMPARDPVTASMRMALALSTANMDLLADSFYWPSLYKRYLEKEQAKGNTKPLSMEDYRRALLTNFKKRLKAYPTEMMQKHIESLRPQLKTKELKSGEVAVVYPAMFQYLKLTLARHYGFWHVVDLPGVEKPAAPAPKKDGEKKKGD